jgi:hypothetical protein
MCILLVYITRLYCSARCNKHKTHQACRAPISWECVHGVKHPGRELDYSPPTSAEIKDEWGCTAITSMPSWGGQGQLYLYAWEYGTVCSGRTGRSIETSVKQLNWMSTVVEYGINTVYPCILQESIILTKKCRYIDLSGGKRWRLGCNSSTWSDDMVRLFLEQVMEASRFRPLWQRAKCLWKNKFLRGFF